MNKYKLYKLTVEHTIVVAAESHEDVEKHVKDILTIHADNIIGEGPSNFDAELITNDGELPYGWEPACLPYTRYSHVTIPEELCNKKIQELL